MHTLEQLRAFIAVYEKHSFSAAGRLLNKDRTTVRELVRAYEDALGYELFNVIGRKAVATQSGDKLYPHAVLVARQDSKLVEVSRYLFDDAKTHFNIGYDSDFPFDFLEHLESWADKYFPQVDISWLERNRETGLEALKYSELDFAFFPTKGAISLPFPAYFQHLGYVGYGLYVGAESKLACKSQFDLEDAQLEIQYLSENALKAEGAIRAFSYCTRVVSSSSLIIRLLQHQGWALLPNRTAESAVKQGVLQKKATSLLCNDFKVPFSLFYTVEVQSDPFIVALRGECERLAKIYFH
ncbi:LysR family transcriptional regulator [Vibrio crassostreae]|uniref:LysR family transcriptional regulator n=1 Tax=Vibrio crassostreae TaxID=246167 RepID=UPI002FE1AA31